MRWPLSWPVAVEPSFAYAQQLRPPTPPMHRPVLFASCNQVLIPVYVLAGQTVWPELPATGAPPPSPPPRVARSLPSRFSVAQTLLSCKNAADMLFARSWWQDLRHLGHHGRQAPSQQQALWLHLSMRNKLRCHRWHACARSVARHACCLSHGSVARPSSLAPPPSPPLTSQVLEPDISSAAWGGRGGGRRCPHESGQRRLMLPPLVWACSCSCSCACSLVLCAFIACGLQECAVAFAFAGVGRGRDGLSRYYAPILLAGR